MKQIEAPFVRRPEGFPGLPPVAIEEIFDKNRNVFFSLPKRCAGEGAFSWPNNSDAIRSPGITAQLTLANGYEDRSDRR
jgi:hypothetical protein